MNLVLFTDSLGSGGAQRQLCLLASEFQKLGHTTTLLTYNSGLGGDGEFFGPWLDARSITHEQLRLVSRWRRPMELHRALSSLAPDAVLAFQEAPSLYAELAGLAGRRWGLVVSERNARPQSNEGFHGIMRIAHRSADGVATNSQANRALIKLSPGCGRVDVHVIYNAVNMQSFIPAPKGPEPISFDRHPLKIVVLARHERQKNLLGVLKALLHLRGQVPVQLRWYGGTRADRAPFEEGERFISENKMGAEVQLLPPTQDARQAYWESDAVLLASWYEGCPNVICEAMACGKPVLVSAVSDNPLIVQDGVTGLLFDPNSPAAIAETISRFAALDLEKRQAMGSEGRRRAEALFDPIVCARRYEELLSDAATRHGGT